MVSAIFIDFKLFYFLYRIIPDICCIYNENILFNFQLGQHNLEQLELEEHATDGQPT